MAVKERKLGMMFANPDDVLFSSSNNNELKSDKSKIIMDVDINNLVEYHLGNPFSLDEVEITEKLMPSIADHGVQEPIEIRKYGDGYEILSGHSRVEACRRLGLTTIPSIIVECSDDEAEIRVHDANYKRDSIKPSDKAKAFKRRYEAMQRINKGINNLNLMSAELSENKKTIQRYLRIAELDDSLLEKVDEGILGTTQAYDISFLDRQEQFYVNDAIELGAKISVKQAQTLHEYKNNQENQLDRDVVNNFIFVNKKTQRKITLSEKVLDKYFDKEVSIEDIEDIIMQLLGRWKQEGE